MIVIENKFFVVFFFGFKVFELVLYKVVIVGGGIDGLMLQKIDYIFIVDNMFDISVGQIGCFCFEVNGFVIGVGVGELEFEFEENEFIFIVDSLVGEWGIFVFGNVVVGGVGVGVGVEVGVGIGVVGGVCGVGIICWVLFDVFQCFSGCV